MRHAHTGPLPRALDPRGQSLIQPVGSPPQFATDVSPVRVRVAPPERLAVAGAALVLMVYARDRMVTGDAAAYASTIETGRLAERSIHIGYYAVMWLMYHMLAPFRVPLDQMLIVVNAVLMSATLLVAGCLFDSLGASRRESGVAMALLLLTGNILMQGTQAEIYALQLLCVLGSQTLFLERKHVHAGVVLGLAWTISPLTLFACGPLAWASVRRRELRPLLITLGVSLLVFLPVLGCVWHEYFFGQRGLLGSGSRHAFSLSTLAYNVFAIIASFHWMLPFVIIGALSRYDHRDGIRSLALTSLLCYAPVLLCMREDGVFALPAYPFIALLGARGVWAFARGAAMHATRRWIGAALATAGLITCGALWLKPVSAGPRRRLEMFLTRLPEGSAIVTGWGYSPTVPFYHHTLRLAGAAPEIISIEYARRATIERALRDHRNMFLIDDVETGALRDRVSARFPMLRLRHAPGTLRDRLSDLDPGIKTRRISPEGTTPVFYAVYPPE